MKTVGGSSDRILAEATSFEDETGMTTQARDENENVVKKSFD